MEPGCPPYVRISSGEGKLGELPEDDSSELVLSNVRLLAPYTRHTFLGDRASQPGTLEVNGRKGRRVLCVLDQDGLRYRVFDLDSNAEDCGTPAQEHDEQEVMME